MPSPSPNVCALSRQLLEHELRVKGDLSLAARSLFERLECIMSELVGADGYGALTVRARDMTSRDHTWLSALESELPAGFPGCDWAALIAIVGTGAAEACALALFADVLQLCGEFLGEELTFRVVAESWGHQPLPS